MPADPNPSAHRSGDGPWPGDRPGDVIRNRLVAYRGNPDCTSLTCTRDGRKPLTEPGCFGYHCSLCDAPCSSQGHFNCPRAGDVANA